MNLECRDFDLKEEAIIYRQGLPGNKSKKTQLVKIPSKVFNVLRELVDGRGLSEKIHLRDGKPIKTIRTAWQAVQKELPVRYRFHDLRHTFGSMLNEAGVDNKTKQEMLRHSSLATTEKYVHTTPEMHSKAAKKLEDF